MGLEEFWFVLIGFLWGGYFLLEGFDFGVGMLLPVLPRDERERGLMFESIGPVWDGNEVWLVVAAGATFAAFPAWYATMFSGFYIALLLILVLLIVRVVSFEWREKRESRALAGDLAVGEHDRQRRRRRSSGASRSPTSSHGVPLDSSHVFTGDVLDLFSPYTVAAGLAVVAMFALHGATYLTLRTVGDLRERASAHRPAAVGARRVLGAGVVAWTVARRPRPQRPRDPADDHSGRADRDRADPGADPHTHRPKRLGVHGHGTGRDRLRRDDLHRPVSAGARLGSRRSPTASRSPTPRPGTTRSR